MFDLGALLNGSFMQPTAASTGDMTQGWGAQVNPTGQPQAPGINPMLGAMQGFKGPAPIQPIMGGGTSGPAAPRVDMQGMGQTPVMNALMQFIQGQQLNPMRVPSLGMLLQKGGMF
jgi:hypothetical protein